MNRYNTTYDFQKREKKQSSYEKLVSIIKQLCVCSMMMLLLVFGNTTREWLHQFSGHEDTVHVHDDFEKGTVIEGQHHHCKFLDIPLPVYSSPTSSSITTVSFLHRTNYRVQRLLFDYIDFDAAISDRGPPMYHSFLFIS